MITVDNSAEIANQSAANIRAWEKKARTETVNY